MDENDPKMKETEEEQATPLRLITGGKSPPGNNWLMALNPGTVFLCRPITEKHSPFLEQWHILGKNGRYAFLVTNLNTVMHAWVDSVDFSRTRELSDIIIDGAEIDERRRNSIQLPELADDDIPKGIIEDDEEKE